MTQQTPGLSPSQRDTLRRLDSLYADPAPPALEDGAESVSEHAPWLPRRW